MHNRSSSPAPLAGIHVLDFGQGVAGPYCGQLLADQGADVIKIEPPRGDWARTLGTVDERGYGGTFVSLNRNKRAICLNLKKPAALEIVHRLAARVDVVVENFRHGIMETLGLGYETLRKTNKHLVYVGISGFGRKGPNIDLPAGDSTMQAYGGLMSIIGEEDRDPLRVGNVVTDMVAGNDAYSGVLLALFKRERTGEGSRIDVALLNSLLAFQAAPITEYLMSGKLPQRMGNEHPLMSPSGAMKTLDSYIVFTVIDHRWIEFCNQIGMPELLSDPMFSTSVLRQRNRRVLKERLQPVFAARTTAEWLAALRQFDISCAPINDYANLMVDEQVKINRIVQRSDSGGEFPMIRNQVQMAGQKSPLRPPPMQGEHTTEILKELGLDAVEIESLVVAGAAIGPQ